MTVAVSHGLRGPLRKRESHLWTRQAEDWYVEPEWCSARLFELEQFTGSIWDPACGGGNILKSARAAHLVNVWGTDIVKRGELTNSTLDFLEHYSGTADNIVSNPPFGIAEKFVARALDLAKNKVAMLLPANWVQGDKRSRWLEQSGLRRVYFITPRPSMPPGHVLAAGRRCGSGTTDYAWFVWLKGYDGAPEIRWLRRDL